jgi:polyphosphate kinase 2 (PPK2 family)
MRGMDIRRFVVPTNGKGFKLHKLSTNDTGKFKDPEEANERRERGVKRLAELQDVLYASDSWAILLIFQAMDAAGKDSTIKHVMSGVNPQGCQVFSFKSPSAEELDHDFMWRVMKCMPERGRIGIFNRSYYEEVLVVKVHPEFLSAEKLPPPCLKNIWDGRFEDINNIEKYLVRDPTKNWKFSESDVRERGLWDQYHEALDDMLRNTSTKHAPWYVIPADQKWYMRMVVADIVVQRLEELDLQYPEMPEAKKKSLQELRKKLSEKT